MRSTSRSSRLSAVSWVESLSPWPADGFGLERMRALLAELGEPQRRYRSIHVVGTNGKSTVTRTAAAILRREGLRAGAYTSPHVSGWAERIEVDGAPADFEAALARVREPAERLGATQFEILTAAALAEFAAAEVDAAVVEAGLGGRLDATNVLDAEVVVLTNISLEHTDVLGDTLRIFESVVRPREDGAGDREAEVARVRKELERVEGKLGNASFTEKAPREVVEAEEAKRAQYRAELEALGG